jgi:hypothetical protein
MVALFGAKAVCAKTTEQGCVLYPAAREWAEQVNEAMVGGHCEGMAVMAARLFRGDARLADLDPDAGSTYELTFEDPDVRQAIDLWWAAQMLAPVQEAYTAFHSYRPSEIAAELAVGLQTGKGYTMGIYGPQGGHGITPFAVTQEGDRIAISVYDNNFPGTVQRIYIDPVTERWSYAMGSTNPDAPTGGWEGSTGTIELTPMASRALPAAAPFDDTGKRNTSMPRFSYLMVTSPDPESRVGLELTVDGRTYDTTDLAAALPEGVSSRPIIGSTLAGKGTVMTIDRSIVRSFTATAKKGTVPGSGGMSEETPVTLSIDAVGSPRITARYVASEAGGVEVSSSAPNKVSLVASGSQADVNVANGLSSVDFPLSGGLGMTVDRIVNGVSDVVFVDEDGNVIGEYAVDAETQGGDVIDTLAVLDEETGEFSVTEEVAEEELVDDLPSVDVLADESPDADANADVTEGVNDGANDGVDDGVGLGVDDAADADPGSAPGPNDDPGQEDPQGGQDDAPGGQDSGDAARAVDPAGSATEGPGADDPGGDGPAGDESGADPAEDSGQE